MCCPVHTPNRDHTHNKAPSLCCGGGADSPWVQPKMSCTWPSSGFWPLNWGFSLWCLIVFLFDHNQKYGLSPKSSTRLDSTAPVHGNTNRTFFSKIANTVPFWQPSTEPSGALSCLSPELWSGSYMGPSLSTTWIGPHPSWHIHKMGILLPAPLTYRKETDLNW